MSLYRQRREDLDLDRIDDVAGQLVYHRAYEVAAHATLADVDLERADFLPDTGETTAVIIASRIERAKMRDGKPGLVNIARVVAVIVETK